MSELTQASPSTIQNFLSPTTRVDSLCEIIAFARRWTQATLYLRPRYMMVIGGYATFMSKLNLDRHSDRSGSLSHVDPVAIKVKHTALLIGILSIHLLKAFVDVAAEPASISNGKSRSI